MITLSQSNPTNVGKAINLLPLFIKILGESTPKTLQKVEEGVVGGVVEGVVKYLPVVDLGINVCEAVLKQNDISVDKKSK